MKRLHPLKYLVIVLAVDGGHALHARELPVAWDDDVWRLKINPASGALVHIENRSDPQRMNWLREEGRWTPSPNT